MNWLLSLLGLKPRMSFREVIDFYRTIGFFEGGTLDDAVEQLQTRFAKNWNREFNLHDKWDDWKLLLADEDNVWSVDLKRNDIFSGNNAYVEMISQLGSISRGVFSPHNVKETWEGEDGPINITFNYEGREWKLHPRVLDNAWLDLDIIVEINKIIDKTGKHFAASSDVEQGIVFLVTRENARKMRKMRRFPFMYRLPK